MKDSAARIGEDIAGVTAELGLDWRTSWSKITADEKGNLHVAVSRREVYERLTPRPGVEVELAGSSPGALLWALSSVVDIRRGPEHSSELLTQAIMGETMVLLEEKGDWRLVMLDDGYHGWVRAWSSARFTGEEILSYQERADAMVGAGVAYVLSAPGEGSLPVTDITAGSRVVTSGTDGNYTRVELPGGREGFIETARLEPLPGGSPAREGVTRRAGRFLGIPYVWGGTSAKGFDCSGLVKRVFRMEGIETPRDADQQSAAGVAVDESSPARIPPGALLFFGEGGRITHVAISTGGGRFIHSYGDVRVNSLLPGEPDFEERLSGIYLFSRDLVAET